MSQTLEIGLAVVHHAGDILITRRPLQSHLGGLWEFPGGKRESGESIERCAVREVYEEVELRCHAERELVRLTHEYPDRTVELVAVGCSLDSPRIAATAKQVSELRWIRPTDRTRYSFPNANDGLWPAIEAWAKR